MPFLESITTPRRQNHLWPPRVWSIAIFSRRPSWKRFLSSHFRPTGNSRFWLAAVDFQLRLE